MPFSATTVGRITGSAYGARQRSTRCMPTLRETSPEAYPRMSAGRLAVVARPTSAYAPTPRQSATASRTSSSDRPGRTWCGVIVAISASLAARSASWLRSRPVRLVLQVRHAPARIGQVVRGDGRVQAVLEVPGQVGDLGAARLDRLGQGDRADGLRDPAEDGDPAVVDADVVLILGPPVAQPAGDGHSSQDGDGHQGEEHPPPTSFAEDDIMPTRSVWRRVLLALVAVAVLAAVAVAGWLGYRWTQDQYYVGVDNGRIAVFRGIPQTVGPISLSEPVETSRTEVANLPGYFQDRLAATIPANDLADARRRVADLEDQADGS